jgi:glycosyltransferase involved in cell wall biosynthesis
VPPVLSIIVPTANRASLWRRRWLWSGLLALERADIELIIIDDHSEDDTLAAVVSLLDSAPLAYPVTLARCLTPHVMEHQASAAPDQVGFGLAEAPLILHLDDDLRIDPGLVDFVLGLNLTRSVLWCQCLFVQDNGAPLTRRHALDYRLKFARGHIGIAPLCSHRELHWGPAFAVPTRELRAIGGHNIEHRGYRNSDTRLGHRLVANGCRSLLALDERGIVHHLGQTWHAQHKRQPAMITKHRRVPEEEPLVANGGLEYWTSPDFASSFEIVGSTTP